MVLHYDAQEGCMLRSPAVAFSKRSALALPNKALHPTVLPPLGYGKTAGKLVR